MPCGCIIPLLIVIVLISMWGRRETFTTQSHAENITGWFKNRLSPPNYTSFRRDIPDSNVVEYNDALRLYQTGAISVDAVKKILQ